MIYEIEIVIITKDDDWNTVQVDKEIGHSLTEVLSKLPLMIHMIKEKECAKRINEIRADNGDDIPF